MPGQFTVSETLNTLRAIFDKHKSERVCVIGTVCVGKSTILGQLSDYGCLDMDAELWPSIPPEEMEMFNKLSQAPWSKEFSDEIDRLTYKYLKVKPGYPMFTSVIVNCEAVVYLDINDNLLALHCEKRGESFKDAKKIKDAIEDDWNNHKLKGDKTMYYVMLTE